MGCFVNCIKSSASLERDIKTLIPEMNIRRRMSRVVKMGVCCGLESLLSFEEIDDVDAIITSTSLGAIADGEKFLTNIITSKEKMLNPTLFIQSTVNTVGAHIALIRKMQCYNNTFVQRDNSFESGLLEAILRLKCGVSRAVLVGVFDEATPTVENILTRLGVLKGKTLGEGAIFFILTKERYDCSVAEIDLDINGYDGVSVRENSDEYWSGAMAMLMLKAIEKRENTTFINDFSECMKITLNVSVL